MQKFIKQKLGALKVKENLKELKELCAEDLLSDNGLLQQLTKALVECVMVKKNKRQNSLSFFDF